MALKRPLPDTTSLSVLADEWDMSLRSAGKSPQTRRAHLYASTSPRLPGCNGLSLALERAERPQDAPTHDQHVPARPAHAGEYGLRAYDVRGWMHPATGVHDGTDLVAAIEAVLAEPGVVQVHSRNVAYGCYMLRVTRAG